MHEAMKPYNAERNPDPLLLERAESYRRSASTLTVLATDYLRSDRSAQMETRFISGINEVVQRGVLDGVQQPKCIRNGNNIGKSSDLKTEIADICDYLAAVSVFTSTHHDEPQVIAQMILEST